MWKPIKVRKLVVFEQNFAKVPFTRLTGGKSGPLCHTKNGWSGQPHTNLFPRNCKSDRELMHTEFDPK
jgi:hypothetical protein